jgi:hypothetical protein
MVQQMEIDDGFVETGKAGETHIEMLRRQQTQIEIDPKIDKIVTRKFDLRIIPWLFGIW